MLIQEHNFYTIFAFTFLNFKLVYFKYNYITFLIFKPSHTREKYMLKLLYEFVLGESQ